MAKIPRDERERLTNEIRKLINAGSSEENIS